MKGKSARARVKRPAVSPEDQAVFLEAMADVKPLAARDRVNVPPPPPSPVRVLALPAEVKLAVDGDKLSVRDEEGRRFLVDLERKTVKAQ